MINNRKCVICGKEYSYCSNNCRDSIDKPSWMASFCSENCKKIYETCAAYFSKQITKKEAKDALDKCDLEHKNKFTKSTQNLIEKIYEDDNLENKIEKIIYKKSKNKKR